MNTVRVSQPRLADIVPYDPKYLPAKEYLSANENPRNVPEEIQLEIQNGNRVILVGMTKDNVTADGPLTGVVPLKAIVLPTLFVKTQKQLLTTLNVKVLQLK